MDMDLELSDTYGGSGEGGAISRRGDSGAGWGETRADDMEERGQRDPSLSLSSEDSEVHTPV